MKSLKLLITACVVACLGASAAWSANPIATASDDAAVTVKVKTALVENPSTKARQIDVQTQGGVVQLNGFVDSAAAKAAAETTARNVAGVSKVDNNLEVRGAQRSVGGVIDDATITTRIKAAMVVDNRTKAYEVDVKTNQGTVLLGGFVATAAEKSAAQQLANSVEGVTKVENNIVVDSSKAKPAKSK